MKKIGRTIRAPGRSFTVNETTARLNPEVFGDLGSMEASKPESHPGAALVQEAPNPKRRKAGMACGVKIVVKLIACVNREMDLDNCIAGCKFLRDSIASSIGADDGDRRIRWEYSQTVGIGAEGVLVKVERL